MQRFLVLTGFIALGLIGLGGRESSHSALVTPVSDEGDYFGAHVVPAVLYSDANASSLWPGSTELETVATHQRARRHRVVKRNNYTTTTTQPRVVVKRRKLSHSAAIVGGSAAGGALVGGLVGGGKGAAIGAVAGGGAGLIYDRKRTRKRLWSVSGRLSFSAEWRRWLPWRKKHYGNSAALSAPAAWPTTSPIFSKNFLITIFAVVSSSRWPTPAINPPTCTSPS